MVVVVPEDDVIARLLLRFAFLLLPAFGKHGLGRLFGNCGSGMVSHLSLGKTW